MLTFLEKIHIQEKITLYILIAEIANGRKVEVKIGLEEIAVGYLIYIELVEYIHIDYIRIMI